MPHRIFLGLAKGCIYIIGQMGRGKVPQVKFNLVYERTIKLLTICYQGIQRRFAGKKKDTLPKKSTLDNPYGEELERR